MAARILALSRSEMCSMSCATRACSTSFIISSSSLSPCMTNLHPGTTEPHSRVLLIEALLWHYLKLTARPKDAIQGAAPFQRNLIGVYWLGPCHGPAPRNHASREPPPPFPPPPPP